MRTIAVATLALAFTGCSIHVGGFNSGIKGSGNGVSEMRDVPAFSQVELRCHADVTVDVGPMQTLTVDIDDNLAEIFTTHVEGDTLVISTSESCSPRVGPHVHVTIPALTGVRILGSGDINASGVNAPEFSASIAGSGDLTASGTVGNLTVRLTGSGDAKLTQLVAQTAKVRIVGSGDVQVAPTVSLDAGITGSGDIRYVGQPSVTSRVTGSGDVRRR